MAKIPPFKLPLAGSVDLFGKPFTIADDKLRQLRNLIHDNEGNLIRRGCLDYFRDLANVDPSSPGTTAIVGTTSRPLWMEFSSAAGLLLFASSNGSQFDLGISVDGAALGGLYAAQLLTTVPNVLPAVVGFAGSAYVFWGPNPFGACLVLAPGTLESLGVAEYSSFEGTGNATVAPHLATEVNGRAWYGNFGNGDDLESSVLVSDRYEPLVIGDDALSNRQFIVGGGDGDQLTAIHPVMTQAAGSPASTLVLLFKTNSLFIAQGEPTETDDPDYFGTLAISRVPSNCGCIAKGTIADTPWGTIWCGVDDVWFLPFGSVPIPIGKAIRPILKAQPPGERFRCHAVYHDGFYRLALFSAGQGPGTLDPLGEQWWLALRDGPPSSWQEARWNGPMVFNVASALASAREVDGTAQGTYYMATDPRAGGDRALYGIHQGKVANEEFINVKTGPVLCAYDVANTRDVGGRYRSVLRRWTANTAYEIGEELVVFGASLLHPSVVVVTTAGTSGATEPAWTATGHVSEGPSAPQLRWGVSGYVLTPMDTFGAEASVALTTKEMSLGERTLDKLWQGLEVNVLLGAPERLQLTQLVDTGRTTDTITKDIGRDGGFVLGEDFLPPAESIPFSEDYKSVAILSDESTLTVGKVAQLTLEELPGIVLDDPTFYVAVGLVQYSVTLGASYYASALDLVSAVADALHTDPVLGPLIGIFAAADHSFASENLISIHSEIAAAWAPDVATAGSRHIWALLGFTDLVTRVQAADQTANELAFETSMGSFGLAEAIVRVRTYRRRTEP